MPTAIDRITKTPDVCGGYACIRGTRITIWGLVQWRRLGKDDEWILTGYPSLTPADLQAAWEYAAAHSAEIEQTGEGLRRCAGALADDPEWDAIMEEIHQTRKLERRPVPENE